MADILDIGISGLKASQTALTITGHNITNAGTEGYSRQVIGQSANSPQNKGGVWVGSGVSIDTVTRIYDQFLTEQMWRDSSSFNSFETLATNAGQIDSLLADPGTGIQPGLENMFGALQAVVDDPSSLPARAVLLSQSDGLLDRFSAISDRLTAQNEIINGQMEVMAGQISTIASSLAELNEQIQFATASAQGVMPNDLLDQRDKLVKDLSELVKVDVVEQDDAVWNVFIGNGQALVIGNDYNEVFAGNGATDPSRSDIYFRKGDQIENITNRITGGQLGGTLDFRNQVLDPVLNGLGRTALVINQTMNDQHKLGVDYDGEMGENFFTGVNEGSKPYTRILGDAANKAPNDRVVAVNITDAGALTTSDYELEFPGPDDYTFRIKRVSDGEIVKQSSLSGAYPETVSVEGFDLVFEAGSFAAGDDYLIMPTRGQAAQLEMNISRPEQVAVASPILTDSAIGNRGNAIISQGDVYDTSTPYFSAEGSLTPPLLVRFTSPTTYDVLDNSDPANPIPLFPPLMNQTYVPGISNDILPDNDGKTAFTSFGGYLPVATTYQPPLPAANIDPVNGFFPERIVISYTDPNTGQVRSQPTLITQANASAKEIAAELSKREGVEASARTTIELSDFSSDATPFLPLDFSLNGVVLTDIPGTNQTKYDESYPTDIPDPMTPDFLADRINANFDFQEMGIIARSDGETLKIIALNGEDLDIEITGDHGDGFSVSNGQDIRLTETGETPFISLSKYDGYDFDQGGPYSYSFDVPGQGQFDITMTGSYATGNDVLQAFRTELEQAGFSFSGNIDVDIDERGNISFQPRLDMRATGANGSSKIAMGGQIKVVTDPGYSLDVEPPGNNLFADNPVGEPVHFGFDFTIDGLAQTGDEFTVNFNTDGTSDSRNGAAMAALESKDTVNGNTSYSEDYARLVENIGALTSRALINRDSAEVLFNNSQDAVVSMSGVNLDEEASALIRYELAYNASAQVIQVAQDIFDTLISTFR